MKLSDDRCCFNVPLREHDQGECRLDCDVETAILRQALRDTLAGIPADDRLAFERRMRGREWPV